MKSRAKRDNRECLPGETSCRAGTFVSHVQVLRESGTPNKRIYEVVVIEAGESLNKRFYPDETLQSAVPLFDGKSVHAFKFSDKELNHLPDVLRAQSPLGGPLGNKVGTLKNPKWCPQRRAVIAELHIPVNDTTKWFIDMADSSLNLHEPQFGFSIDGEGEAFPKRVRGKVVEWVESLSDIFSLDAVSNPAAGGRLLAQAIVENVVGDPSHTLQQYELRSRRRRTHRRPRPKRSTRRRRLRSSGKLNEGVNMNSRTTRRADGTGLVRKLLRTLGNERDARARAVRRKLRLAESVSQTGQVAEVNVDGLRHQLEAIPNPSGKVRSAISQLNQARAKAQTRSTLREQGEAPALEPEMEGDEFAITTTSEPLELVEELMELLEDEADEPVLEVHSTLKKAKEFSEAGGSVEINIKELLEKLDGVEEPTKNIRKAVKLLKDELKQMEGDAELEVDGEDPSEGPQLKESYTRGFQSRRRREAHRSLGLPASSSRSSSRQRDDEVGYLRRNLRLKEHQERLRTALQEAEGNGLPKALSEELYGELRDASDLTEHAIKNKINTRLRQANALVESLRPDFRDIGERPRQRRAQSPIEKVIFEAR